MFVSDCLFVCLVCRWTVQNHWWGVAGRVYGPLAILAVSALYSSKVAYFFHQLLTLLCILFHKHWFSTDTSLKRVRAPSLGPRDTAALMAKRLKRKQDHLERKKQHMERSEFKKLWPTLTFGSQVYHCPPSAAVGSKSFWVRCVVCKVNPKVGWKDFHMCLCLCHGVHGSLFWSMCS